MLRSLDRFLLAQAPVWPVVVAELAAGRKASHWMRFVSPQIEGLGRSATARHFALAGLDEVRSNLDDPILGSRLREATALLLRHAGCAPEAILGAIDAI